ncbi:ABC transporter ATP-binding protein [Thermovenabulum sp.]|uniref:ABC transporter ATP-binding protein n=1 Tax=Thermovenabulum sp. TaxID=3100335 RepID=UPI003C79F86F
MLPEEIIKIEKLTKTFKNKKSNLTALKNINLSIIDGEFLCIVGPSGCGKTTLLRILAGLEKQTEGKIYIKPKNPGGLITSMVFQGESLFPWMSVIENVEYGLKIKGIDKKQRREKALEFLEKMGLTKFADYYPHQISGGMKQRVNVARAFVSDPDILLMDEPFGALDEQNRLILQQELLRIWEGSEKTTIFITHSIDEALFLGDRIVVMTAHPGRIKAKLRVDIERPRELLRLRTSPHYNELYKTIWELLEEEVRKAEETRGVKRNV